MSGEVSSVCCLLSGALGFDSNFFRERHHLFEKEVSSSVTLLIFEEERIPSGDLDTHSCHNYLFSEAFD